jgi:hypothetical protein
LNFSAILDCSQTQQVPFGSILKDVFKTVLGFKIRSIQLYIQKTKKIDPSAICNISATQFLLITYEIWKVLVSLAKNIFVIANFHVLGLFIPEKLV